MSHETERSTQNENANFSWISKAETRKGELYLLMQLVEYEKE